MLKNAHITDPSNGSAWLSPTQFNRGSAAKISISVDGSIATVTPVNPFDFSAYPEFNRASEALLKTEGVTQIEVDMNYVEHLDSSALGMLLQLREDANVAHCKLLLLNCKGMVRRILEVSNFNRLFTIK